MEVYITTLQSHILSKISRGEPNSGHVDVMELII